ncbi:hypothetical protein ZWY2020_059416 [Hordeum vulgare]|nr:hypothetical protein ZWY2020_059416 [Hordeum vulgare]
MGEIPSPAFPATSHLVCGGGGGRARGRGQDAKTLDVAMEWDPWLIVSHMVCLQCLYYLGLGLFMALLVGTRVPSLTLLYLFDFATLTARTTTGRCAIAAFLLAAIAGYGTRALLPPASRQDLAARGYHACPMDPCTWYWWYIFASWYKSNGGCIVLSPF